MQEQRPFLEWRVGRDASVPPEVANAAQRGIPILAIVPKDAPIDGWAAELLEEYAEVVRYGT